MKHLGTAVITTVVVASTAGIAVTASAQEYPSKTVTMIVPFPAGGSTDVLGRILAQHMTTSLRATRIIGTSATDPIGSKLVCGS